MRFWSTGGGGTGGVKKLMHMLGQHRFSLFNGLISGTWNGTILTSVWILCFPMQKESKWSITEGYAIYFGYGWLNHPVHNGYYHKWVWSKHGHRYLMYLNLIFTNSCVYNSFDGYWVDRCGSLRQLGSMYKITVSIMLCFKLAYIGSNGYICISSFSLGSRVTIQ